LRSLGVGEVEGVEDGDVGDATGDGLDAEVGFVGLGDERDIGELSKGELKKLLMAIVAAPAA
jgi:hypothetical protein